MSKSDFVSAKEKLSLHWRLIAEKRTKINPKIQSEQTFLLNANENIYFKDLKSLVA
jgi:hypothetical protein